MVVVVVVVVVVVMVVVVVVVVGMIGIMRVSMLAPVVVPMFRCLQTMCRCLRQEPFSSEANATSPFWTRRDCALDEIP
jgi:hypothetical protein